MINFIIRENKKHFQSRFHSTFVCSAKILLVSDRYFLPLLSLTFKKNYETENYLSSSAETKNHEEVWRWFSDTFWIAMAKHDLRQSKIDIKDTIIVFSTTINNCLSLNWKTITKGRESKEKHYKMFWSWGFLFTLWRAFRYLRLMP